MANVKIHSVEELTKMSEKDRLELMKESMNQLAHQKLRVKTNEDKQSHKITALKNQIARIKTLNNTNKTVNNEK